MFCKVDKQISAIDICSVNSNFAISPQSLDAGTNRFTYNMSFPASSFLPIYN